MRRRVITVSPQTPAQEAIDVLVECEVSGLPVVDPAGHVVGVFSEIDRIQQGNLEGKSVHDLMSQDVVIVDVQDSLADVARVFREKALRRLPVTEAGVLVGIIGLRDLFRCIRDAERTLQGIKPVVQDWDLFETGCWNNAETRT